MSLFALIKSLLTPTSQSKVNSDILRLAKTEYKKDWEYAYNQLMEGKKVLL
jgi:hypothetical protein